MITCAVHDIHWFCVTVSRNQVGHQHPKMNRLGECLRLSRSYTKLLEKMGVMCFPAKGVREQDASADLSTVVILYAVLPSCKECTLYVQDAIQSAV